MLAGVGGGKRLGEVQFIGGGDVDRVDVAGAEQGRKIAKKGDPEALRPINRQLGDLFPGSPEERRRSFGSGVR